MIKDLNSKVINFLILIVLLIFTIPYIYIFIAINKVGTKKSFANNPSFFNDDFFKFIYPLPAFGTTVVLFSFIYFFVLLYFKKAKTLRLKMILFTILVLFIFLIYHFDPQGYLFWFFD